MPPPTGHNNGSKLGDVNEDNRCTSPCTFETMRPSYESSATYFRYNTSTDLTAQLETVSSEIENSGNMPQGTYSSRSSEAQDVVPSNKRLRDNLESGSELVTVANTHSINTESRSHETSDSDTSTLKDTPRTKRRRKGRKKSKESAMRMAGTAHPLPGAGLPLSNLSLMSDNKTGESSLSVLSLLLLLALGSILLQPGPVPPINSLIPSEQHSILDNLWLPSLPAPYKFGSDVIGQHYSAYQKPRSRPFQSDKYNRQSLKRGRSHDSVIGFRKSAQYHQDLESKIERLVNSHLERMATTATPRESVENERQNSSKRMPNESGEREFFDPMVGHFRANPSTPFDSFFKSKLRWRGDAELAQYAWNRLPNQVNMLLTEQIPAAEGRRPPSPAAMVALATSAGSAPATSPVGTSTSQQNSHAQQSAPATDPSLMDYEAIDIFWRQDLEQEKGTATLTTGVNSEINYGNNPTGSFTAAEQFERDLQLLTEKSFLAPLNPEERQCYENLSKAHYTDFYRALGPPPVELGAKQQNEKRFDLASTSSSGSGKLPGGSISGFPVAPTSSQNADQRASNDGNRSNASNTNSTVNEILALDDKLFTGYDEETPEDFFRHLAKENLDDIAPLPAVASTERRGSDDLRDPLQLFSANVSMCVQHPALLNNVSLADAVPTNIPSDLFATNLTTGGTNTTMSEMFTIPQTSTVFENMDAVNNMTLNSTDTWFQSNSNLNANELTLRNITSEYPTMGSFNQTGFAPYLEDISITTQFPENVSNIEATAPQNPPEEYGLSHTDYLDLSAYNDTTTTIIVDYERPDRASPSSGIGSMSSSSSSPRSTEEFSGSMRASLSRFHSKLVPAKIEEDQYMTSDGTIGYDQVSGGAAPRKRGRQSKDEQLVSENRLPATAEQITTMSHQELQKLMRDPKLTATQKALVKKIRRRGRNKVAARKCRERRLPLSGRNSVSIAYDDGDMYESVVNQIPQNAMPSNVYLENDEYDYERPSTSKDSMRMYYTSQSRRY